MMHHLPLPSYPALLSPTHWLKRLQPLVFTLLLLPLVYYPQTIQAADLNPPAVQDCDINNGPCSKKVGTAQVVLDIDPKPVKAMKELTFTITVKGMKEYESLRLKLKMPDMYMGNNEVRLVRAGGGRYTGKGAIPKCHSGKRLWVATVEIPGLTPPETSFLFNVLY